MVLNNAKPKNTAGKGPAVDASGSPVVDPTENVKSLVLAGLQRQDDLRTMESGHIREILALRAEYDRELRLTEAHRINAIRTVDVEAVARAAEVSAQQANTLALQVATSAETLRTQVATVAAASAASLASALQPITKSIEDLRQAQYQTQGQQAQRTEGKDTSQWVVTILIAVIGIVLTWIASNSLKQ